MRQRSKRRKKKQQKNINIYIYTRIHVKEQKWQIKKNILMY